MFCEAELICQYVLSIEVCRAALIQTSTNKSNLLNKTAPNAMPNSVCIKIKPTSLTVTINVLMNHDYH